MISNITEIDGAPSVYPWKIKFPNGSVTDNGDGTVSIDFAAVCNALYLKLDQTTPQSVINGAPTFEGDVTDAIILKAGKRLVFDG